MSLALVLLFALGLVGLILAASYQRWQRPVDRERFLLGVKEASRPENMRPDQKAKLKLLRSPWWALWHWLPDLWRRTPMS